MPTTQKIKVVLDTNCLIASLSRKGRYYKVWKGLQEGKYILCVSNEIINEYLEIIGRKTNSFIAENVVQLLVNCEFVELHDPSSISIKSRATPKTTSLWTAPLHPMPFVSFPMTGILTRQKEMVFHKSQS